MALDKDIIDLDGTYNQGKPVLILKGQSAVSNQIFNLFSTASYDGVGTGERIFEPTYGANLDRFLFEPLSENIALDMADFVYDQVSSNLSNVLYTTRENVSVKIDELNSAYVVEIMYYYGGKVDRTVFAVQNNL